MRIDKFNKEQFLEICKYLNILTKMDCEYLYGVYQTIIDEASEMVKSNVFGKIIPINSFEIILYLVNEYSYQSLKEGYVNNDESTSKLMSITLDKYFTNEHLSYKNDQFTTKYSIIISTLDVYLNLMLGILEKFPKNNPRETLLVDIANKSLKLCKAISNLIVLGFETEAFSTWRTLHESECILEVINKYKNIVIKSYLKHINYAIAFRGGLLDKEKTDKVFEQLKGEMKTLELKSKDMKKFIEYGWLYAVPEVKDMPNFKLNFRDGVERVAGLERYSKIYEMASEIAHSSPLLIYSQNRYFYHLSIIQLYESFFRLEHVFCEIYLKNVSVEERKRYFLMRKVYYPILIDLYEKEKKSFTTKKNKKQA